MKKKIFLILCLVMLVLGVSACGMDRAAFEFYGLSYTDCETIMTQNVTQLAGMSEDELQYYEANSDEVYQKLFAGWQTYAPELGAYVGLGEFTLDKAQDTMTLEQEVLFENRALCVTFVLEYNYETKQVELTDTNADLVYTMGEKMTKAALNTVMGMGTVFVVLILISLIIYSFRFISVVQDKLAGKSKNASAAETKTAAVQNTPAPEAPLTDDLELAAVIAAAIAASEGTTTDAFVVRSIHRR